MAFTVGSTVRRTMPYTTTGRVEEPVPDTSEVMT